MMDKEATTESASTSTTTQGVQSPVNGAEATTGSTVRSSKNEAPPTHQQNVRQWFSSLSPEECAAALGFTDGPWLMLWTQLAAAAKTTTPASPSLSATALSAPISDISPKIITNKSKRWKGSKRGNIENPKRVTDRTESPSFDLQAAIPIDDIERRWKEITGGSTSSVEKGGMKNGTTSGSLQSTQESENEASDAATANEKVEKETKSNAYRILHSENKDADIVFSKSIGTPSSNAGDDEIPVEKTVRSGEKPQVAQSKETVLQQPSSPTVTTSDSMSPPLPSPEATLTKMSPSGTQAIHPNTVKVAEIMNNVCSIFPAAFDLLSSTTSKNTITSGATTTSTSPNITSIVPFITLHPTYITTHKGEDLLSAFDSIMTAAFTNQITQQGADLYSFIPRDPSSALPMMNALKQFSQLATGADDQAVDANPVSIPLYMLLLLRFRSSLMESFQLKHQESSRERENFPQPDLVSPFGDRGKVSSWFKLLDQQVPSNKVLTKLDSTFPQLGKRKDTNNSLLRLLLPLLLVTDRLLPGTDPQSQMGILSSINSDITSFLPADAQQKKTAEDVDAARGRYYDDLEAIVAELDAPGNGAETAPNGPNGTGGKKSKRKKKKKKKNRAGGTGTNSTSQSKEEEEQSMQDGEGETDEKTSSKGNEIVHASLDRPLSETPSIENYARENQSDDDETHFSLEAISRDAIRSSREPVAAQSTVGKVKVDHDSSENDSVGVEAIFQERGKIDQDKASAQFAKQGEPPISYSRAEAQTGEHGETPSALPAAAPAGEDDEWETVGARPRDRRKKGNLTGKPLLQQHGSSSSSTPGQQGGSRRKETRRRNKGRRIVKEIVGSLLDRVDEESRGQTSSAVQKKPSTMRDILMGGGRTPSNEAPQSFGTTSSSERAKALKEKTGAHGSGIAVSIHHKQPSKTTVAKLAGSPADQNTVPTISDTLSTAPLQKAPGNDSSSGDSLEAQKSRNPLLNGVKDSSPSPPLPTLLSPGNNNSSSSSVASSLDAPHGNLPDPTENEVGYHLLGVCKRLSDEIALFMKRRDDALSVRRHERKLVLAALEDTLSTIWPGMCSVEMYGSCATNLDLPSSDLDVVVCGLDRPIELVHSPSNLTSSAASTSAGDMSATEEDAIQEEAAVGKVASSQDLSQYSSEQQQHFSQQQIPMHHSMHMMYPHMSPNAERVMRLAVELEHQPWAVHVKAIPTATVPVIKVLADPARLSGTFGNNSDWLVQHSMAPHGVSDNAEPTTNTQSPITHYPNGQAPPLWRGADVVNGLLKVDITFEGPEHGGIGSTRFSAQAVEEFAAETGLAPEATPAVQVLMVLKELLAQRRLNEPFSGGLSSYALLLLVISVIKERSIIREELEKAERQRRVVAAGGGNSAFGTPEKSKKKKESPPKPESIRSKKEQKSGRATAPEPNDTSKYHEGESAKQQAIFVSKGNVKDSETKSEKGKRQAEPAQSSWATIARQTTSSGSLQQARPQDQSKGSIDGESPSSVQHTNRKDLKKPSSFADAVAKGVSPETARHVASSQQSKAKLAQQPSRTAKKDKVKADEKSAELPVTERKDSDPNGKTLLDRENGKFNNSDQGVGIGSVGSSAPNRAVPSKNPNDKNGPDSPVFPQGFHDVVEVLCSGETTPGKLLLHFLLFYGQHFDSQSTAIDFSRTHPRDASGNQGYSLRSPYMQRRSAGNYDPVTGMLTVDPIVVYDPLEGAEANNVARSCFAWSSIRWLFAQSYMTLSSTVETNASQGKGNRSTQSTSDGPAYGHDQSGNVVVDPNSPLLELLLSY